ncbi:tripartite tricarboxylate transporter substrate binding protein [Craurococcus roseus]|uniref:Tripartite tricarboxylate transporter substrate binding protein n=2 Tax=Craurococcus roseus TaxID=77585 RepID=A0ABP3QCM5_9PROT
MAEIAGHQFVVENRSGSAGNVGADAIAKARPDGATVGLGGIASHAIAPTPYASLPFDHRRDFALVSGLWRLPNMLVVNNDLPARTVPELIEVAKSRPGGRQLSCASAGAGTTLHLSGAMFAHMTGAPMLHVPYRGGAPAMVDVIAGRLDMIFDNIPGALAQARQGKVRPLAVTGKERNAAASDVPALAEHLPGFDIVSWTCLAAPAGLPPGMAARMNSLTRQALAGEELRRSFADLGAAPWWTAAEDLEAYRTAQEAALRPLILASGARVE